MPLSFDSKTFLKTLTNLPGVYQMYNVDGEVLYVGKAKNLKKRVASYFRRTDQTTRIASLVKQIARVDVIITETEGEAFLLENNLIKQFKPRYNILFRDDKSYPYIFLSAHADYPRMDFHRGAKKEKGNYYGPYPSAWAVRESLSLMQKLFLIRQCEDTFFKNRTRPCIQYQINRCTAPCVGYIDVPHYQENVKAAFLFLDGKSQELLTQLMKRMEVAAENQSYEEAASIRDQIVLLRKVQEKQYVVAKSDGDIDIMVCVVEASSACVNVLFVRGGRMIGSHPYFPKTPPDMTAKEVLAEFIPQYYLSPEHQHDVPKKVLVFPVPEDKDFIAEGLGHTLARKIKIEKPARKEPMAWMKMAIQNAKNALASFVADKLSFYNRFEALQNTLKLSFMPERMECFDISHSFGEATVGSCVVFNREGPVKSSYRRFNIENITPGDDYAALSQALSRRYIRLKKENSPLPDVIIIDGGKGQLRQGEKVLEELQLTHIVLLAIAKGPERRSGFETIYMSGKPEPLDIPSTSLAFHLLQQIRNEAHRFAITGHKGQRAKKRLTSPLQAIPGIGPKRRQLILQFFGGLQEVMEAKVEEIAKVPGISIKVAQIIYDHLHGVKKS